MSNHIYDIGNLLPKKLLNVQLITGLNEQSPINNACTGYSVILIQIMKPSKSLNYFL